VEEGTTLVWAIELMMYGKWCHSIVGRGEMSKVSSKWEVPGFEPMVR